MGKIASFLVVATLVAPAASAQELRPYQPPSGRSLRFDQLQGAAQSSAPVVDEAVYERFRVDVQRMDAASRMRLATALQQRLDRARQDQRYEEARYNERLLGILGSIR